MIFTDAKVWADDKQLVDVTLLQSRDPRGAGYVFIELTDDEGRED